MFAATSLAMDINKLGEIALLMFLIIFLGVVAWTASRRRCEVRDWSRLPLEPDAEQENQEIP